MSFQHLRSLQTYSKIIRVSLENYLAYIISQRMLVSFDVLCLLFLPLLIFSVFKFYTKGNLIIIVINSIFQGMRWISALIFEAGESQLKKNWNTLLEVSEYGNNQMCDMESCGCIKFIYI